MRSLMQSLGFPLLRPVLDHLPGKKPQVVWKYSGGDPCPYASKGNATASIRFICDPNVGPVSILSQEL